MTESRSWHKLYEQLGASPEVQMLKLLEPEKFDEDEEWAFKLRQQFPTVPPEGVEMCHKNWLVGLDILLESIGNEVYQRENFWCGDVPIDTIIGLGIRRRIMQFWLKGQTEDDVLDAFITNSGEAPHLVRVYYAILGNYADASFEIKQDIQNIVDILVGPFIKAGEALSAKWRIIKQQQAQRNSILKELDDSVITCLCNYYTCRNVDALVRMIARQQFNQSSVGGCNNSLKFLMHDEPQIILGSTAISWACYLFVAGELGNKTVNPPEVLKDLSMSALEKLGNSNKIKLWLAASLGLLVKAWVKRAWAFMNVNVKRDKLPNFEFDLDTPKIKRPKTSKAPKLNTTKVEESSVFDGVEEMEVLSDFDSAFRVGNEEVLELNINESDLVHDENHDEEEPPVPEIVEDQDQNDGDVDTITRAMTSQYTHGFVTRQILESDSLKQLEDIVEDSGDTDNNEAESKKEKIVKLNDPLKVKIKKPKSQEDEDQEKTEEP